MVDFVHPVHVLDGDHQHIVPAFTLGDKPASRDDRAAIIDAQHGCLPRNPYDDFAQAWSSSRARLPRSRVHTEEACYSGRTLATAARPTPASVVSLARHWLRAWDGVDSIRLRPGLNRGQRGFECLSIARPQRTSSGR